MPSAECLFYVPLKTSNKEILSIFGFVIEAEVDGLLRVTDVDGKIQYLDPDDPHLGFEDIDDAIQLAKEDVIIIKV